MKINTYEIDKNVEKVLRGESTGFLNGNIKREVLFQLKKNDYEVFSPFNDAEKIILFGKKNSIPLVKLFKINSKQNSSLTHSAIMGSLFGLNITSEMFGDIVKFNDIYYVYLLESISDLVVNTLKQIGNVSIQLEEVDVNLLENFTRKYDSLEFIVSSLRIDAITSKLVCCKRDDILARIKKGEIFLNDLVVQKTSINLNEGDIFSIRKCGKFCFRGIIKKTKKNNFVVKIDKYI